MSSTEDDLNRAVIRFVEESGQPLHLSERDLLDLAQGELEDFAAQRVWSHLLTCRACMKEYRAVQSFMLRDEQADPAELDVAWAEFQQSYPQYATAGRATTLSWFKGTFSVPRPVAIGALAVVLATIALTIYYWPPIGGVMLNAPIAELRPVDFVVQSGQDPSETIAYSHGDPLFLILVNPLTEASAAASEFAVEILDESGKTVYTGNGLRPNELGSFNLSLEAGFLKPGRYRLILRAASSPQAVAEYRLRLK